MTQVLIASPELLQRFIVLATHEISDDCTIIRLYIMLI
jgi:hypothetical protein